MSRRETIHEYSLRTPEDVHAFLWRWHELGELRFRGDLSISIARIDILDAIRQAGLWPSDVDAMKYAYFDGYEIDEVAGILDVDEEAVKARLNRGCERIAEWLNGHEYNA